MANTAAPSEYARSYNSFGGTDIKAVLANKTIGTLQAISYSITREKAPIYTMGSASPRAFGRGKRGIAGSMVFVVFDRDEVLSILRDLKFQSDIDDLRPTGSETGTIAGGPTLTAGAGSGRTAASTVTGGGPVGSTTLAQQESDLESVNSDQEAASAWYVDQIPPFDITITAANEYGALMLQRIYGVEFLNEGYGISIDDIVSEVQYTYVCRDIGQKTPINNDRFFSAAGLR